jgi:homoserine O-acetyltransferase/O-succinyltransferase
MRDTYVGAGRAIDPAEHYVAFVNQIGSGLGTSPHNLDGPFGRGRFPHVRIGDDVVAQERLLREHLGVEQLALVFGGSMGAQKTYEWAAASRTRSSAPRLWPAPHASTSTASSGRRPSSTPCVPTQTGPRSSSDLRRGLERHAGLFALHVLSNQFWTQERWRPPGFSSTQDFIVGFLGAYFAPMDAGDLIAQAWKWQHGDVGRHADGDLAATLGKITARTCVMPISSDRFFPPEDCAAEQALIPNSEPRVIEDVHWARLPVRAEPGLPDAGG